MSFPTYVVWAITYAGLNPENKYKPEIIANRTRFEAIGHEDSSFARIQNALKKKYPDAEWTEKKAKRLEDVPAKMITEVSMINKNDPGIYVIARRVDLDECEIPFVTKYGIAIGFTYKGWKPTPWCKYDETEFDTTDMKEAERLFQDFVKENKFEEVKVKYMNIHRLEDQED